MSLLIVVALAMSAASRVAVAPLLVASGGTAHVESTPAPVTPVARRHAHYIRPRPDLAAKSAARRAAGSPLDAPRASESAPSHRGLLLREALLSLPPPALRA